MWRHLNVFNKECVIVTALPRGRRHDDKAIYRVTPPSSKGVTMTPIKGVTMAPMGVTMTPGGCHHDTGGLRMHPEHRRAVVPVYFRQVTRLDKLVDSYLDSSTTQARSFANIVD